MFTLSNSLLFANIVTGVVKDEYGYPLKGIKVTLSKQTKVLASVKTNVKGEFLLKTNVDGSLTISFSDHHFVSFTKKIHLKKSVFLGEIILKFKESSYKIDSVSVTAYKKSSLLRRGALSVSSIDTKNLLKKAISSSDLISEISGVNIRTDSGLGSDTNFTINGMGGKQIRFFLDGIPTEYYGTNLNIGVMPPSFFERIDVYKGVVPIQLGADALGGAINLISSSSKKKRLNVNYSLGSFNTHKVSLDIMHKTPRNLYVNLNTFYNHSDNNYKMKDVNVVDKKGKLSTQTVNRFHNKFDNWFVKGQVGVRNKNWADHAFLSFYGTGTKYEVQNDRFGNQVFGKVYNTNLSLSALLKYEKKELLRNADIDFFIVYKASNPHFYDISKDLYNWKGEIIYTKEPPNIGEMSSLGINSFVKDKSLIGQLNLSWNFNDFTRLKGVYQQSYLYRKGKDKIAENNSFEDLLKYPTKYNKTILGLSLESKLSENRLSTMSFLKKYFFKSLGFKNRFSLYGKKNTFLNTQREIGCGQALSYKVNENFILKTSYEYALRLPSPKEIYGNLGGIVPNATLKPEKSHNLNFGALYKKKNISFEANIFFRKPKNLIFLRTSKFVSQYQNISKVKILGIDSEIFYKISKKLKATLNVTWQDIRNQSLIGVSRKYINKRLPNRPYLFGNFNLNYEVNNIFNNENRLKLWYGIRYVKEFFLSWENDGRKDLKNTIPKQFPSQIGFSFLPKNNNYSISFECHNAFDQLTYDKFKLQKPGRSFYITLNYKK